MENTKNIIEINDGDGIISLVNSEKYQTYVDTNWELEQLKKHFVNEMNSNSIIVWQTNNFGGGNWKIELVTNESGRIAHSEFTKSIEITNGKLYLADYTDLTMAAQFRDYGIPANGSEHNSFEIENGSYNIKIRRLFNPNEEFDENAIAFEIVISKQNEFEKENLNKIFWWTF